MKKLIKFASAVSLGLTLIMAGCKGDVGPVGPAGANGTNGVTGQPGTNGTNGTNGATGATGQPGRNGVGNVKSLNFTVTSSIDVSQSGTINTSNFQYLAIKDLVSTFNASYLDSVFTNGSVLVYYRSGEYSYPLPYINYQTGYNINYNFVLQNSSIYKSIIFTYKASDNGSISFPASISYKVVLIPGVAGSRKEAPEVDFNNYEAVKAYYNLAD